MQSKLNMATMSPPADELHRELLERFPSLAGLAPDKMARLDQKSSWISAPPKAVLFDVGMPCMMFPLLLDGEIQVVRNTLSGREIELYRVLPGEPCLVSTSCILGKNAYPARGVALSSVRLATLGNAQFESLLIEHPPFRHFIFQSFTQRMSALMEKVEQVAFMRLEQRLAQVLTTTSNPYLGTHQELADQLGARREVISRQLKAFERSGWITLSRGEIRILDPGALGRLASAPATADL
jgi:CRP/FNR family transcriptional regulator, anaerobic regulatory protein